PNYGIVDMEIQGDFLHILSRQADKLVMDISDPEDVNFLYVEDASLYNCLYNKGIVIRGDYLYFNEGNKIALYNFGRYSYYNLLGYFGEGYSRYRYLFNYNDLYLLAKNSLLLFNDEIDKTYLNVSSLYDESITKNKYEIAFGDSYYNSLKVYNDTLLVYTDSEEMSLTIYHIEDGILTYKNTEYFDYEVGINSNCNNYFVIGCRDRESVLFKINSEYELDYVGDLVRSSYIVNSAKASEYLVLKKGNIIDFVEEDAIDRVVKRIELDPNYYYTYIKDDLFISSYNHNLKLYKVNDNGDNVLIDSHSAYNGYSVFGDIVVTEEIDDFAKIQLDFYKVTYRGFTKIYEMNTNFTSVSISWFKDDNKLVIRSEYGTYLYNVQSLGSEFVVVQDKVIPAQLESNVYPNPVKSTNVNISLTGYNDLSKNINAEISIYNIKGQLIKQDKVKDLNYIWDKRDMNQKEVTSGVYLYKFIVGEAITSGKVVIIK
ncbi:MAG: T9SS type A sorting domain-containing protein, partial [Candidatus Cloacimonetes bacterium]|nr:T9SS type A sorting domain-containing protein [Candidatus Cloacimonadota bacterium]